MEKLSLQIIIDQFAQQNAVSKKVAEQIGRLFFDTIVEGLKTEGIVKINGFGTFKIVEVSDRESVNVSNGERIVIQGYKKVGFTADPMLVANKEVGQKTETEDEKMAVAESPEKTINKVGNDVPSDDEPEGIVLSTPIIKKVEIPANELSSIDMLISTPESIAEVRDDYERACKRAEETLRIAEEANAEMVRLERLLHNLEMNSEPEDISDEIAVEEMPVVIPGDESTDKESASGGVSEQSEKEASVDSRDDAMLRFLNDDKNHTAEDEKEKSDDREKKSGLVFWITVPLIGIIFALCAIFVYRGWRDYSQEIRLSNSPSKVTPIESNKKPKPIKELKKHKPVVTPVKQESKDSTETNTVAEKKAEPKAKAQVDVKLQGMASKTEITGKTELKAKDSKTDANNIRPKSYVMKPGDTLTKLSQRYYGSKDFVSKIIKANNFPNPDNVPIGAEVILP